MIQGTQQTPQRSPSGFDRHARARITPARAPAAGSAAGPLKSFLTALYELTKPTIAVYVAAVAAAGFYLGTEASLAWMTLLHLLVGLLSASGGLLALNQVLEWELDRLMARTRGRPIPSGRLRPRQGLWFALALFGAGVAYLWAMVGPIPAGLTGLAGLAYNFIYTPLKSRSYGATLTGAIPGAFPALVGWSAATGGLELGAWVLFAIAYLWQMPHVLGLAWVLRSDYEAAGFKLTPSSDKSGRVVGRHMILFAGLLLPISLTPTLIGLTGPAYLACAALLGGWLLWLCVRANRHMSRVAARRVFLGSLLYQPLLLAIMLIDKT